MNVLIVQRQSLVSGACFSLSVYARIIEAMDWLRDMNYLQYAVCNENDPTIFRILQWAHVVIFCKHISSLALKIAQKAHEYGCITLLDIDDWIFTFPKYSGGCLQGDVRKTNICNMLDSVDIITVANEHLKNEISKICNNVTLIPNGIYVERYPELNMEEQYPPRVIFTNADFLKICNFKHEFLRVLQDFSNTYPQVIFDFYGDPFPEIYSLPFMHYTCRTPYSDYIDCLANSGYCFAVTPLGGNEDPDDLHFNCCKNPFKYLNYGLAGIPGIYSNVSIYSQCVKDKITGLLVENSYAAWFHGLEEMLYNQNLRNSIRQDAYHDIVSNYHIKKSALLFFKLFTKNNLLYLNQG